ncbi:hypothetical protein C8244_19280 [Paracidovorax avenae]|uniref:hypothetical protein n=1 Tax=Paracidovorax avenae TaxID=80867 RepID=UPI000D155E6D|nr:hypothetical protein [Paracidovorax avenae]AVS72276.1 hypothetical protein C8247_18860 [Paracidovorax avenae]AVS82978.1 hypothetical protein C8237_19150 [Paracidovorax avenae]AVT18104.1 hypothetical protein C8244_19280 [Paracidovorax avenae]
MKLSALKNVPCIVWCLALTACVVLGWYVTRPTLFMTFDSPHRVYRLEIYDASVWQRIVHHGQRDPAIFRLYRVDPKELLGESEVVDLAPGVGAIDWQLDPPVQTNKVYVGLGVVFENIPSECGEAARIPGCTSTGP